ncbi:hypothetical protein Tco_1418132 [Tanacetum coccineum]
MRNKMCTYLRNMDIEKVEGSKKAKADTEQESSTKRAGNELEQEKANKKKTDEHEEDNEVELKKHIADGSTKRYLSMIQMLQNIDREDLETIWKLVKGKYGNTRPEEGFKDLHVFMLVEKKYPLTPITITNMFDKKLQADYRNGICYQLLKLLTKQQKVLLVLKVKAADYKDTTAERITTAGRLMLTEMRSKAYQRRYKDCLENKNTYEDKY